MDQEALNGAEAKASVLIMTAVPAEKEAVLRGLNGHPQFDVKECGVGVVNAAVKTMRALSLKSYDLVISAGIGGAFPGKAEIGSVVLASESIAADLGVETGEGFRSLEEMGFGVSRLKADPALRDSLHESFASAALPLQVGPILTVATASGVLETIQERGSKFPDASAEAMEGFGVALAALEYGIPALEIRAISNIVEPRNRSAWRIPEALASLQKTCSILPEVFL